MAIQPRIPFDSIPLLAGLKAEDRSALEPLCRMHGYEKGAVIFREGEPGDRIDFVRTPAEHPFRCAVPFLHDALRVDDDDRCRHAPIDRGDFVR